MTVRLAFDLGRTSCRAAIYDGERRVASAEVPAAGTLTDPDGLDAVRATLAAAAAALGADALAPAGVGAGVAGAAGRPERAAALAADLARAHAAPAVVTSDVVTSHAGALGGGPGVVVAAGTGAIAYGVDASGRSARVDGWGYLLGDDGSGYAVGRAALAAALRASDGRGPATRLTAAATDRFGPLVDLPRVVHGAADPGRLVAGFAPDVAAAAREGDVEAAKIWEQAVAALVESAVAAARVVAGDVTVSWTGGLFAAEDLVTAPFRRRVAAAGLVPAPPEGDALAGAVLLADRADGPHEPRVVRAGRAG